MYKVEQDYDYLGNDRWKWRIRIGGDDAAIERIEKVVWYLHHSFRNPVVTKTERSNRFQLERQGWGVFQIRAELIFTDGQKLVLLHQLELDYPDAEQDVARGGGGLRSEQPPRNKVFLSYGAEDRNLVAGVRGKLEQRGYEVLDPSNIEGGVPIEAAIGKMVRDSDLVMGFVTSEFVSPLVISELNKANQAHKPVMTVARPGCIIPYGLDENLYRVEIDLESEFAGDELADIMGKFEP